MKFLLLTIIYHFLPQSVVYANEVIDYIFLCDTEVDPHKLYDLENFPSGDKTTKNVFVNRVEDIFSITFVGDYNKRGGYGRKSYNIHNKQQFSDLMDASSSSTMSIHYHKQIVLTFKNNVGSRDSFIHVSNYKSGEIKIFSINPNEELEITLSSPGVRIVTTNANGRKSSNFFKNHLLTLIDVDAGVEIVNEKTLNPAKPVIIKGRLRNC